MSKGFFVTAEFLPEQGNAKVRLVSRVEGLEAPSEPRICRKAERSRAHGMGTGPMGFGT